MELIISFSGLYISFCRMPSLREPQAVVLTYVSQ